MKIDTEDDVTSSLAERIEQASPETQNLIERLLQQDADDQAWAELLGPAYRQAEVAALLGRSKQAVSASRRLLRLTERSGTLVYPTFQFDGRRPLPGLGEVVEILAPASETTWTIASWLMSAQPQFADRRPIDLLRDGEFEPVLEAAQRTAAAWSR